MASVEDCLPWSSAALQKLLSSQLCKAKLGSPGKFSPYSSGVPEETSPSAYKRRGHHPAPSILGCPRGSADSSGVPAFGTKAGIWHNSPSFSPAARVPGGRGAGLCAGVVPSRPRPGKEAVAGQKSSAPLSVCVLLSLLPVLAWEAAGPGAGMQDKEGSGGGSEWPDGWSWCSFPKSSPGNTQRSATSWSEHKCWSHRAARCWAGYVSSLLA